MTTKSKFAILGLMSQAKQKIYLETSVVSAYFDPWRKSPEQKKWTRKFWKQILPDYQPVISKLVKIELKVYPTTIIEPKDFFNL